MREEITEYAIANEIRMIRDLYSGCFLIVEGATGDFRVFERMADPGVCQITPAHSKDNALAALALLEQDDFAGVLAVVDADFWRLEGWTSTSPNLFITDTHDLETMMLKSQALEKLLREYGSVGKIGLFVNKNGKSVRQALLEGGQPLGYLRWISQLRYLSLTFEDIAFVRFVDRSTLTVDASQMIRAVKNRSQRHDLAEAVLQDAIDDVADATHDPWDVCCGHDLMRILSIGLCSALGSNNTKDVKPEVLEKSLRLAYEAAHFFDTQLFQSLRAWEATNQPFRVFAS